MWSKRILECRGVQSIQHPNGFRNLPFTEHKVLPKVQIMVNNFTECEHEPSDATPLKYEQSVRPRRTHYACPECQKRFCVKAILDRHLRIHYATKSYPCPECEKYYTTKKGLLVHLQTHTDHGDFQSSECEKRFNAKGKCAIHRGTPFQQRPFRCTECNKSFTQKRNLIRHQRAHSSVALSQCKNSCSGNGHVTAATPHEGMLVQKSTVTVGGKDHFSHKPKENYRVPSNFVGHQKIYSGAMENLCSECEKTLQQIDHHIRLHRRRKGQRAYKCTACERIFTQNTQHILQERKNIVEGTGKTHTIVVRLLQVSIPNEYFILEHEESREFQIIIDAIQEKLKIK
ncbi:zinc finger protein 501-like [Ambystoma mexicanum]|uniref:zinc finger protein 501-like n=1 Tax=Ambystoma mexicanum TaxID=8296 RepID=UPI0037E7E29C